MCERINMDRLFLYYALADRVGIAAYLVNGVEVCRSQGRSGSQRIVSSEWLLMWNVIEDFNSDAPKERDKRFY